MRLHHPHRRRLDLRASQRIELSAMLLEGSTHRRAEPGLLAVAASDRSVVPNNHASHALARHRHQTRAHVLADVDLARVGVFARRDQSCVTMRTARQQTASQLDRTSDVVWLRDRVRRDQTSVVVATEGARHREPGEPNRHTRHSGLHAFADGSDGVRELVVDEVEPQRERSHVSRQQPVAEFATAHLVGRHRHRDLEVEIVRAEHGVQRVDIGEALANVATKVAQAMRALATVERRIVARRRSFVGERNEQHALRTDAPSFARGSGGGLVDAIGFGKARWPHQLRRIARALEQLYDRLPLLVAQFEQALADRLVEVEAQAE